MNDKKNKYTLPNNNLTAVITAVILPALIIAYWIIGSNIGLTNKSIIPPPDKLWTTFAGMIADGSLAEHIIVSFIRVIKGYFIGAVAGIFLGILIGLYFRVNQLFISLIGILRPIPPIACIPLLILWLGIDEASKVAVIVIGSFWPILLNTISGIQSTDKKLVEVADVFGKNKFVILKDIIIPSAIPSIFTGLRLGISTAWSCVVAAEMIASTFGVGYLIMFAREMSKPAMLFIGIISIGLIGLIIDLIMQLIQKKVVYWDNSLSK